MKLQLIGLSTLVSMAVLAMTASSASAYTYAVTGVTKASAITVTKSLEAGTSAVLGRTDGSLANTCTASHMHGTTVSPYTGGFVPIIYTSMTFESCTRPVTVHKAGKVYGEHISGTSNGTMFSSGAEVTVSTPFGTVNCKTGAGTDIGILTGATTQQNPTDKATMHINAVLSCGFLLPSASWRGSYWITSPHELGVHP